MPADTFVQATPVVVVSGLPRSGTSMMMRMLEAGGLPVLTDGVRQPDQGNPNGYYEFEPVKTLPDDASWIPLACGKAVKIVYLLLPHLPTTVPYQVIFMRRTLEEVVDSLDAMSGPLVPDSRLVVAYFERKLRATQMWLAQQSNFKVLYIDYNRTVADPEHTCELVTSFLGLDLDVAYMRSIVSGALHRNRSTAG